MANPTDFLAEAIIKLFKMEIDWLFKSNKTTHVWGSAKVTCKSVQTFQPLTTGLKNCG